MLASWTQDDALIGGVRLHYYRTGRGDKPPLVLVHGFSDNGLCWSRTAHDLEADYDVVMPDMRGHGLSERMRPGDEVDMAADLAGLIRGLGLGRPIVGGHSMGAMVTYELGVRFPELASALVLEDPPWWLERHLPPPSDWVKELPGRTVEDLLAQYRLEQPHWPDDLRQRMAEAKKQLDPAVVESLMGHVGHVASNWLTTIRDVKVPVLLLTADPALGGLVTPEVVARVRELNPAVDIVNVPNVGHLIRYDDYPAFMAALRTFLKRVSAA